MSACTWKGLSKLCPSQGNVHLSWMPLKMPALVMFHGLIPILTWLAIFETWTETQSQSAIA